MANAASISIVVPTHRRPECLRRLLAALHRQTVIPKEILLVCDRAEEMDPTAWEPLQAAGTVVRTIRLEEASSAAGRNAALAVAEGEVVLCLDDDMVPDPDLLETLWSWYAKDRQRRVGGIGVPYQEADRPRGGRWWDWTFRLLGRVRWRPRRQAARYVSLPAALAKHLEPATMMPGGAFSLRREIARSARFDETFRGYAFGEDRELSYRLGREHALFLARRLRIVHAAGPGGRGDWRSRGRRYVENMLHIARTSTEGGAGTWLLVGVDLLGAFVQHAVWAAATRKRHNLEFSLGLASALVGRAVLAAKELLCGR